MPHGMLLTCFVNEQVEVWQSMLHTTARMFLNYQQVFERDRKEPQRVTVAPLADRRFASVSFTRLLAERHACLFSNTFEPLCYFRGYFPDAFCELLFSCQIIPTHTLATQTEGRPEARETLELRFHS